MNIYLTCFRLNLPLFALSNLMSVYLYYRSESLLFTLAVKLIALPVLVMLFSPFIKRYSYFFHNKGWGDRKLFTVIASMDCGILLSALVLTPL